MNAYINLQNVSLEYQVLSEYNKSLKYQTLSSLGANLVKKKHSISILALRNINLNIKPGTSLGITGLNGAGKTTLLKILSKIFYPTSGFLEINGQINSLLILNEGFDNNLTGKDLIKLKYLLQYNKLPNAKIIDEIKDLTELNNYFDLPVFTYSTGMLLRLLFCIQMSFDSEILILDEWLTVGDKNFRVKSDEMIKDKIKKNKILIIASHDENLIKNLCNKKIELTAGQITQSIDLL